MNSIILLTSAAICTSVLSAQAATLAHRYSFTGDTADSAGGNSGVLLNGAGISGGQLTLPGTGVGAGAANMGFSSPVDLGGNFGGTGVTLETWYTDSGSGMWGKLFTFGTNVAGQEFAFTNEWGGNGSAIDRNGTPGNLFGFRAAVGSEHHLVISVAAAGNLNAWLDGNLVIANNPTNPVSNIVTSTESIGATAWNDPGHFGSVNEFRLWKGELSNAEVQQNLALGPDSLIPEPTGAALLGLGTMLVLRRRRRV